MKKHLIIGGCGFIGSVLAHYLSTFEEEVVVADNFYRNGSEVNKEWLQRKGISVIRFDTTQEDISEFVNLEDFSHIYLLAAQTAVTKSIDDPRFDFNCNLVGTFNVLESIRKNCKKDNCPVLVFSSTNKVYGHLETTMPTCEEAPLDFYTPYGCSKGAAEQYVRDYARIYGIPTVVLRKSCIYGHRQWGTEDQGWLAWFALRILQEKEITIFGDGKQVRDLLYVNDLVKLYYKISRNDFSGTAGKIYNVGGGKENSISLIDAIQVLQNIIDKEAKVTFSETRPGDQPYFVSSNVLVREELGWEPGINIESGMRRLVDWLKYALKNHNNILC
ncbi:MAG: GDP-mannose 4,6-dehydratase [Perlabentimonas sp.]